ncbi:MAG: flippase-like domain-containing protein [Alphaproteobacteria bacterium]|nr:flippase-like domain-containing protein [Alphaproteobacteria bacterium]
MTARNWLILAVKLAIAVALLFVLVRYGVIDIRALARIGDAPWLFAAPIALAGATFVMGALRIRLLLSMLGIPVPLLALVNFTSVAVFANLMLPSIMVNDAVRFFYIRRHVRGQGSLVGVCVLVDRVLSMTGLLLVVSGGLLLFPDRLSAEPLLRAALAVALASLAAIVFGFCLLSLAPLSMRVVLLRGLSLLGRWGHALVSIGQALRALGRDPRYLPLALFYALVNQLLPSLAIVVIATVLVPVAAPPLAVGVATPVAVIVGMLPITPGGIGVGEAAFDHVCKLLTPGTVESFGAVFLAYRLAGIAASLYGGAVWISQARRSTDPGSQDAERSP